MNFESQVSILLIGRVLKRRSPYPGSREFPDDLPFDDDECDEGENQSTRLLLGSNHYKPPRYSIPHSNQIEEIVEEEESPS